MITKFPRARMPRSEGSRRGARLALLLSVLVFFGAGCVRPRPGEVVRLAPPGPASATPPPAAPTPSLLRGLGWKTLDLQTLPGVHPALAVTLTLPAQWEAEVVPEIEAVNLYDPRAPGGTPREQSQVFLRHFRANDFLALSTVAVLERVPTTVAGRPAVAYVIEKKPDVPPFRSQPAWRNLRHRVVDLRLTDERLSKFLVVGKRPDLPDGVFDRLLASLRVSVTPTSLAPPTRDFFRSITKKPFGVFVTPATSPVQPERFSGYHTGTDAELPADTPVVAMADGVVVRSGRVSGYGGLVAIEHRIDGSRILALYGHLDPQSLPGVGTRVTAGTRVGMLGEGFSPETDGERPHLHFGLYRAAGVRVAGYVPRAVDLEAWEDPIAFFRSRGVTD